MKPGRQKPPHESPRTPRTGASGGQLSDRALPRTTLVAAAALIALVAVTYLPVLDARFITDDDINVTINPTLYSVAGLRDMWLVPTSAQQYYPVTYTTFWMSAAMGARSRGYHVVNVMIHAASAMLLWRVLLRLSVPGAWLAAAIFAVHPVAVESVAWITERRNVLSLALALVPWSAFYVLRHRARRITSNSRQVARGTPHR